jgi:hypothetical protein
MHHYLFVAIALVLFEIPQSFAQAPKSSSPQHPSTIGSFAASARVYRIGGAAKLQAGPERHGQGAASPRVTELAIANIDAWLAAASSSRDIFVVSWDSLGLSIDPHKS